MITTDPRMLGVELHNLRTLVDKSHDEHTSAILDTRELVDKLATRVGVLEARARECDVDKCDACGRRRSLTERVCDRCWREEHKSLCRDVGKADAITPPTSVAHQRDEARELVRKWLRWYRTNDATAPEGATTEALTRWGNGL